MSKASGQGVSGDGGPDRETHRVDVIEEVVEQQRHQIGYWPAVYMPQCVDVRVLFPCRSMSEVLRPSLTWKMFWRRTKAKRQQSEKRKNMQKARSEPHRVMKGTSLSAHDSPG